MSLNPNDSFFSEEDLEQALSLLQEDSPVMAKVDFDSSLVVEQTADFYQGYEACLKFLFNMIASGEIRNIDEFQAFGQLMNNHLQSLMADSPPQEDEWMVVETIMN